MPQQSLNSKRARGFMKKENTLVNISIIAIMTALVTVGTLIIRIPNPMGGYFNVGRRNRFSHRRYNWISTIYYSHIDYQRVRRFPCKPDYEQEKRFPRCACSSCSWKRNDNRLFSSRIICASVGIGLGISRSSRKHRSDRNRRTCRNSHSPRFAKKTARNIEILNLFGKEMRLLYLRPIIVLQVPPKDDH